MSHRILIVDDSEAECALLLDVLRDEGFDAYATQDPLSVLQLVATQPFDVVLTDLNMPGMGGIELCGRLTREVPGLPIVVVTAFGSIETAVESMRAGAYDFITKPFEADAVALTLRRTVDHHSLKRQVEALKRVADSTRRFGSLQGTSAAMLRVYDLIERVAPGDATVLITGESGTGKELVARELHRRGDHGTGPLVAINCAAVPEALLESELFGHVRGAFTGARTTQQGLLLTANGGTLLLDEIGDMPMGLQPKLLRALQERSVRPLGGREEIPFDARVIAATNRDLEAAVDEQSFREDLYFRLNVIRLDLPPLRARAGDVLLLAGAFLDEIAARNGKSVRGFAAAAAKRLLAYDWPGNVRELRNCVERAVSLCRSDLVSEDDLPQRIRDYRPQHVVVASDDPSELLRIEEVERRYILRALEACRGNKSLTAQTLGMSRKTLYRRLETYGVGRSD